MLYINHDAFSCFVVCPDVGEKELDMADALFAKKTPKTNAAEMSGGIDYFPGELRLKPILERVALITGRSMSRRSVWDKVHAGSAYVMEGK